jgi:general secretion pathway protein E/type IV pilus assembly protein PilB
MYPRGFKSYKTILTHFEARGCSDCYNTGYKGRKAVYEVIPIDEELAEQIKNGNHNTGNVLKEKGIKTLSENAYELFENGMTSLEEIYSLLMN